MKLDRHSYDKQPEGSDMDVRSVGNSAQAIGGVQNGGFAHLRAGFANYLRNYATQMHLVGDQRLVSVLTDAAKELNSMLGPNLHGVLLGGSYSLGLERPGSDVDYYVYLDQQVSEIIGQVKTLVDNKLLAAGYRPCQQVQERNIRLLPEMSEPKAKLAHASEFVLAPFYNYPIYGDMVDLRLGVIDAFRQSFEGESVSPIYSHEFNSTRGKFLCLGADIVVRKYIAIYSGRDSFTEELSGEVLDDLVRQAVPFAVQRDNRFPLPKELETLLQATTEIPKIFSAVRRMIE